MAIQTATRGIQRPAYLPASETLTSGTASGTYTNVDVYKLVSIIPTSTEATYKQNFRISAAATDGVVDGMEHIMHSTATGIYQVQLGTDLAGGTATAQLVFADAEDMLIVRYMNSQWRVITNVGATFATIATG